MRRVSVQPHPVPLGWNRFAALSLQGSRDERAAKELHRGGAPAVAVRPTGGREVSRTLVEEPLGAGQPAPIARACAARPRAIVRRTLAPARPPGWRRSRAAGTGTAARRSRPRRPVPRQPPSAVGNRDQARGRPPVAAPDPCATVSLTDRRLLRRCAAATPRSRRSPPSRRRLRWRPTRPALGSLTSEAADRTADGLSASRAALMAFSNRFLRRSGDLMLGPFRRRLVTTHPVERDAFLISEMSSDFVRSCGLRCRSPPRARAARPWCETRGRR